MEGEVRHPRARQSSKWWWWRCGGHGRAFYRPTMSVRRRGDLFSSTEIFLRPHNNFQASSYCHGGANCAAHPDSVNVAMAVAELWPERAAWRPPLCLSARYLEGRSCGELWALGGEHRVLHELERGGGGRLPEAASPTRDSRRLEADDAVVYTR